MNTIDHILISDNIVTYIIHYLLKYFNSILLKFIKFF